MQTASNELSKQAKLNYDAAAALKSIDGMIGKVEGLKRKVRCNAACAIVGSHLPSPCPQLSDLHENAGVPTQTVMRERLTHLSELENFHSRDDASFGRWADTRLDRWLVDWALRAGKDKTAKKIAREKGIEVRIPLAEQVDA